MTPLMSKLAEATAALQKRCPNFPKVTIVLGSGLGTLFDELECELEIPFEEIPHLKKATVEGHPGRLTIRRQGTSRFACMQGRLHFYEGHSMQDVVFPYRALALAGCETFVLTNAAGGMHAEMTPGDLVVLTDHINLTGTNPLIGPNEKDLGPRFPDLCNMYDSELRRQFLAAADKNGVKLRQGVYVGLLGPSFETPAEIRMLKVMGGDVVGMSTVPEAIALRHMGKKLLGISCVTNLASGIAGAELDHNSVMAVAKKSHPGLQKAFVTFIEGLQ